MLARPNERRIPFANEDVTEADIRDLFGAAPSIEKPEGRRPPSFGAREFAEKPPEHTRSPYS
jgi:hypothetical protein